MYYGLYYCLASLIIAIIVFIIMSRETHDFETVAALFLAAFLFWPFAIIGYGLKYLHTKIYYWNIK